MSLLLKDLYLTETDIRANSDKCKVVINMETPTIKKGIIKLNGMLTTLNRLISISYKHAFGIIRLIEEISRLQVNPRV